MRHAVSAPTKGGSRRQAAGLLDAPPQAAERAEFGDRQQLIGIGGKAEVDHSPRIIERDTAALERPQIVGSDRKHEAELLGLGGRPHYGPRVHRRRQTGP